MASTNKTTNYELSQFVGSDIPAWLSDYNGDMSKIDAGIHAAKVQADGAASGVSILQTTVSGKQDALTFDSAPIAGSQNPVTSGGIYTALQNAQVQTDAVPTEGSTKAVQSGGVYTALLGKQNTLTFDSTPTENSRNPVTSGGLYTALQNGRLVEIPVLRPSDYTRVYTSRCLLGNNVLTFYNMERINVLKSAFTVMADSSSWYIAESNAGIIQGNPLNLPTYNENNLTWLTDQHGTLYVSPLSVKLRFDGTNTRIVYIVTSTVYQESSSNIQCESTVPLFFINTSAT